MFIKQLRYSNDNLGYFVYSGKEGIAIDAGNVEGTLVFAKTHGIALKYVTNTHSHYDHTPGNQSLLDKTQAQFIDCRKIKTDQIISIGDEKIEIYHTPGHTHDSMTFRADDFLVTGDTLFNGTIGNCFSGDLEAFFYSLKRLMALPENTKIYAGHDYVMESMAMAKTIEKNNPYIEEYIKKYNPDLIVSTLRDELNANPFIRFNDPGIIADLNKKNMPTDTEFDRFKSIMEIY